MRSLLYPRSGNQLAPALHAVLVLVFATILAMPALAREEIGSFATDITLRTDGSVRVIETVDVRAEQVEIRRGIYRDIPTVLLGPSGNKIRVDFAVESVTRAGRAEVFRVERMGNFQRIWIGDPEQFIGIGEHRYVITYTLGRMARPFPDHDELYFNATGNYWNFPILTSVARVTLPDGAVISDLVGYTGEVGSTEQAVAISQPADNVAIFRTIRALAAGEGMSFSVSFNKGVIAYPQGLDALGYWLSDAREIILSVIAVILLLAYNFTAWMRVGRDPPKGVIIPRFHPPKDFSPALTHYVHNWGFANSGWTALTAAIFSLGVRGLVTIKNPGKLLSITRTERAPEVKLPVGEQILFNYFDAEGTVTVDKAHGKDLGEKRGEFTAAIEGENRSVWFNHNFIFAIGSFVLAFAMMVAMVVFDVLDPAWLFGAVVGGVMLAIVGGVIFSAVKAGNLFRRFMVVLWGGIIAFNVSGAALDMFTGFSINTAAVAAGSLVLISVVFAVLMRAPTVQGRNVMDEIEGFKLYLETAERNRLNITGEPPMTVDRFERILPYAIALGVEKPWSGHFEGELARNAVTDAGDGSYSPRWYSSSQPVSASGLSRAISTASTGMAAAMVAAQPVQASSSGSSGGGVGFSGGGGGGGGGGGW